MEVQGKIIAALDQRTGESRRNPGEKWVSQDFVVETHDQYSRKMMFTVFGQDRLSRFNIQVGQEVNVSFDIDAHEWNGRWFNDVRAFDVRQVDPNATGATGAAPMPTAEAPQAAPFPPADAAPAAEGGESTDDLPF